MQIWQRFKLVSLYFLYGSMHLKIIGHIAGDANFVK